MNEKNIDTLMKHLNSLGASPGLETELRINICFQQDQFRLTRVQVKEDDVMTSVFYFRKKDTDYYCSYYEASLRKKITLPAIVVNAVDVKSLQERMEVVKWNSLLSEYKLPQEKYAQIENIVDDLEKLSLTSEGRQLAEQLKIKFWIDSPLGNMTPNLNPVRSQYEISQRFYFFEGEAQITLDEAYRFLSHRWREKQLYTKRKETEHGQINGDVFLPGEQKQKKVKRHNKAKRGLNNKAGSQ